MRLRNSQHPATVHQRRHAGAFQAQDSETVLDAQVESRMRPCEFVDEG